MTSLREMHLKLILFHFLKAYLFMKGAHIYIYIQIYASKVNKIYASKVNRCKLGYSCTNAFMHEKATNKCTMNFLIMENESIDKPNLTKGSWADEYGCGDDDGCGCFFALRRRLMIAEYSLIL